MSGPTAAIVYDCQTCGEKDNGCKRPWKFDYCYQCEGKNHDCKLCGGSGKIRDDRCPRAIGYNIPLLPYFYEWYAASLHGVGHTAWPDGGPSLQQPIKLKQAYWLLNAYIAFMERKRNGSTT
jgi:hypothetical protein